MKKLIFLTNSDRKIIEFYNAFALCFPDGKPGDESSPLLHESILELQINKAPSERELSAKRTEGVL